MEKNELCIGAVKKHNRKPNYKLVITQITNESIDLIHRAFVYLYICTPHRKHQGSYFLSPSSEHIGIAQFMSVSRISSNQEINPQGTRKKIKHAVIISKLLLQCVHHMCVCALKLSIGSK